MEELIRETYVKYTLHIEYYLYNIQGMIDRLLTHTLKEQIKHNPAVVLLGPRQVGKTTLALSLTAEIDSVYLDLEKPSHLLMLSDPESFFKMNQNILIILDEIQRAPDLFNVLRGTIDENRARGKTTAQFLLLGSASMDLLKQSSESLAGRICYSEMYGLNVLEAEKTPEDILKLWFRGGFPESYLAKSDNISLRWLENFIRTYIEREVPQLGLKIPSARLLRLWTMLAHLQGETVNHSTLANNLDIQRATVHQYLDVLCDLLLIRRIEPWYSNVKKRLIKTPRYYIRDSGIVHRLLGIRNYQELLSNPVLGKSWEGFVIENIHSVLPFAAETFFYRTAAGAEIDLVIKLAANEIWAIEIKHGIAPKLSKHFIQTCDDVGATEKFVIYGGDKAFPVGNGVTFISLSKFMQKVSNIASLT